MDKIVQNLKIYWTFNKRNNHYVVVKFNKI